MDTTDGILTGKFFPVKCHFFIRSPCTKCGLRALGSLPLKRRTGRAASRDKFSSTRFVLESFYAGRIWNQHGPHGGVCFDMCRRGGRGLEESRKKFSGRKGSASWRMRVRRMRDGWTWRGEQKLKIDSSSMGMESARMYRAVCGRCQWRQPQV